MGVNKMDFPMPILEDNYPIQDMYDESYSLRFKTMRHTLTEQEVSEIMFFLPEGKLKTKLQKLGELYFGW
jgi:hypothetical protein